MHTTKRLIAAAAIAILVGVSAAVTFGQTSGRSAVKTIEVTAAKSDFEVGEQAKFSAVAKDEAGKLLDQKPSSWFAAPFDLAAADANGTVTFYQPGEVTVFALFGNQPGFIKVLVKPTPVKTVLIDAVTTPLAVGGTLKLNAIDRKSVV